MKGDKELVATRFARHYGEYHHCARMQRLIAEQLAELLHDNCPDLQPSRALEIGMGTGFLSEKLVTQFPDCYWYFNDMVEQAFDWLPNQVEQHECLLGDAEQLALPAGLDLIASASAMQWFGDIEGFLQRAAQQAEEGSVLAMSSFGPQHMQQIRQITGLGLDYYSLEEMKDILEKTGWRVLCAQQWQQELYFDSGRAVLQHLRSTGVNGLSATSTPWTARRLVEFHQAYKEQYASPTGELPLSYHPTFFIARRAIST